MRCSRCLFRTAVALHRVFIAPIDYFQLQLARRIPRSKINSLALRRLFSQQNRCYAAAPPMKSRLPRDDEIRSWTVILVNEEGTLDDPRSKLDILESIDRTKESLVVVVPGEPGTPPICKIMNKKTMREGEKARAKAARGSGVTTKTIELNWAIDKGDLGHRIEKMKQFLGKGFKVEIVLAGKRKGKQAKAEEAEALVKRIREAVVEVDGGREVKPMEGKLLGTATMFFEGKPVQKEKVQSSV
jgi:translation initiation factor IF-3